MSINIVRYEEGHVEAVKRLNARLAAAGETWRFPEHTLSHWLPDEPGQEIVEHYFVAVDGDEVRGGYILKWQPFWTSNGLQKVCTLYLPLSEGIIHPAFKLLGLTLVRDALKRNALAFCLGMGGAVRPLPQTLKMLGWQVHDVPFFYLPLRAGPFLRHLRPLQTRAPVRLAAHLAAATGLGALGLAVVKGFLRAAGGIRASVSFEQVGHFDAWADEVWQAARDGYSLCADRGMESLNRLYPRGDGENRLVVVREGGRVTGWFVARSRAMRGHKYFGSMRVGSLIDGMALPGHETAICWAARSFLDECGSDIIVCNMQHDAWRTGLKAAGWLSGPSNFALAASPKLAAAVGEPYAACIGKAYFLRGDGEGPTHL